MSESLREALAEMLSKRDGGQREYDAHLDAGDAILAVLASFLDQHEAELVEAMNAGYVAAPAGGKMAGARDAFRAVLLGTEGARDAG